MKELELQQIPMSETFSFLLQNSSDTCTINFLIDLDSKSSPWSIWPNRFHESKIELVQSVH